MREEERKDRTGLRGEHESVVGAADGSRLLRTSTRFETLTEELSDDAVIRSDTLGGEREAPHLDHHIPALRPGVSHETAETDSTSPGGFHK